MEWTAQRDRILTNLWQDGVALVEIALLLNITTNAVGARRQRLKLPARKRGGSRPTAPPAPEWPAPRNGEPWTQDEDWNLKRLWLAGDSPNEIANKLRRDPGAVCNRARKLGLQSRSRRADPTLHVAEAELSGFCVKQTKSGWYLHRASGGPPVAGPTSTRLGVLNYVASVVEMESRR